MLSVERRKEILNALLGKGSVTVGELARKYGVRDETIRRDLKELARGWDIEIVYGGAHIRESNGTQAVKELAIYAKRSENYEAKQIIARKSAELIEDGDMIGLNSGSTVEYIIDYIGDKSVHIITLNVNVAAKALLLPKAKVYIPGGRVRNSSGMVIGPGSIDFIKAFAIDKCFFGISALCKKRGIMHPVLEEVELNAAMLSVSDKNYVVTDSSKINTTAFFSMTPLDAIDCFIVDDDFPSDYREYLALNGINVI
ncbi:MAG: DeoR/GlpR family DNA-binding transcription regulator [Synergistaceae bacterium]|jgi:DeoR/GlpR family transcriptional regulator of sugar metabolism|nr:DeoR/GlpR family DNA-binding transcription regulator [Synergistaceae bacterium]